ncbi:MAG: hypothetical protein IJV11_05060 [Muribaculaceae bacterium]|nr:hypothetical protein [Muribaculaceae bacterium]
MLRPQSAILLISLLLGIILPGCGGRGASVRYDGRLAAADSLLRDEPDSALAIITALPTDSLATEHDRAYRYLLLTQARYRAYVTVTSDSDINRAVAYFAACRPLDREKLTRAYISKGAVMDELGHPDSAMLYYKHAEATAAPDDYFNLGYVKMRIATLYLDQLSQDSAAIMRLKEAIGYFEMLNDTNYLISCYGNLGAICGVRYPDSTENYLVHAIDLAEMSNSPKQYTYKSKLAGFYYYKKKDYETAIGLVKDILQNGRDKCGETQFYYYGILSYIRMGLLDSAKEIFNQIPNPVDKIDSMNYHKVVAEMEFAENHPERVVFHTMQSGAHTNSILSSTKEKELVKSEVEFEKHQLERKNSNLSRQLNNNLSIAVIVIVSLCIIFGFLIRKKQKNLKKQQFETEQMRKELETLVLKLKEQKTDISKFAGLRISALSELYQAMRFKKKTDSIGIKKVVSLSTLLKDLEETYMPLKLDLDDTFWLKLRQSVDGEYNDIVNFIENNYPGMKERDIKLFCLLCSKIPPQIIKLCMNYSSSKTASSYRNRMIQKKMGLDMTFDDFIKNYLSGRI